MVYEYERTGGIFVLQWDADHLVVLDAEAALRALVLKLYVIHVSWITGEKSLHVVTRTNVCIRYDRIRYVRRV